MDEYLVAKGVSMSLNRRENLKQNRVASVASHYALLSGPLAAVVLVGLSGCIYPPGSEAGTVAIELTPGETASGDLFSGQSLRAITFVEAGHAYEFGAALTVATGAIDPGAIEGVVSGAPLAAPVEFTVGSSVDEFPGSQPLDTFIAQADGEVAIEFLFPYSGESEAVSDVLEGIRRLIIGTTRATYALLVIDLGFDDNATSPQDAVALAVGPDGEQTGTLTEGDEADYFALSVQADTSYQLNLESTDSVNLTSGFEDRFGQANFGVPTPGGLTITVDATGGVPGISQFTAPATEEVLLRVAAAADSSAGVTIQYAISAIEVIIEEE